MKSKFRTAIIKKKGDEWCVYTGDGKEELGCHPTEQKAKDQLAAIEISKVSQRHLTMRVDTAQIRTAMFDGREHIVVPVIALMEGVIHAINVETPELVLASELEKCYAGFNGRPVVGNHPNKGSVRISANDPKVLEQTAFGTTFNAKVEDKKLKIEAWIDPSRVSKVGAEAERVLERVKSKEMVEVSVGVFVSTENTSGTHGGKQYKGIWRSIVPDHLAMLPEGTEGACNVDMGCGAPRAAQKEEPMDEKKTPGNEAKESMWDRIKGLVKFRVGQDDAQFSDMDLRESLTAALRMIEPGFEYVEAVFPNESLVVYSIMPGDVWQLMRRSFTVSEEDGSIELKDDIEEVHPVTRFEAVTTAESEDGGTKMKIEDKLKERLEALIKNEKSPWTPCDLERLAQFPEERIAALEAAVAEPEVKLESKPEESKSEGEGEEEVSALEKELGVSADDIKKTVKAAQVAEKKKKEELITSLKTAQDAYSEEELNGMEIEQLQKVAKLAKAEVPEVDFSGKGVPRQAEDNTVPAPPSVAEKIKSARATS